MSIATDPEAVAFHIAESHEGITARGDYTGEIPGAIRPLLKWTTNYNLQLKAGI